TCYDRRPWNNHAVFQLPISSLRRLLEWWSQGSACCCWDLAYAVDWANAGRIYVDPFLRFPYYANNFLLFYSALFVLKLGSYCHFLNWLCGLLTCLGVLAFFTGVENQLRGGIPTWKLFRPQQFLIPLSVALSPVFLRYLNVAFIDIPIGLFLLIPILCA